MCGKQIGQCLKHIIKNSWKGKSKKKVFMLWKYMEHVKGESKCKQCINFLNWGGLDDLVGLVQIGAKSFFQ